LGELQAIVFQQGDLRVGLKSEREKDKTTETTRKEGKKARTYSVELGQVLEGNEVHVVVNSGISEHDTEEFSTACEGERKKRERRGEEMRRAENRHKGKQTTKKAKKSRFSQQSMLEEVDRATLKREQSRSKHVTKELLEKEIPAKPK
jgi:hypothetical protein